MPKSDGRLYGNSWEDILVARARSNGIYAEKNHLMAKFRGGARPLIMKSNLDFTLFFPPGRLAVVDAKTYNAPYFDYSELLDKKGKDHQIQRALLYLRFGFPSGFVVWFRPVNQVVYFRGDTIAKHGPGTRFYPPMGISLGRLESFDLRGVFAALPTL